MTYGLPKSLTVSGREEPIRWEYTAALDIIETFNDPNLKEESKAYCAMYILYENFENFRKEDFKEAYEQLVWFLSTGKEDDSASNVKVVDFEQDYNLLIPAINRIAGKEIRAEESIHWWTFMSWFMEIGECTYSTVLSIRSKLKKGKPLEKWEREFYGANKKMVDIQWKLTEEEKEKQEKLNKLLD